MNKHYGIPQLKASYAPPKPKKPKLPRQHPPPPQQSNSVVQGTPTTIQETPTTVQDMGGEAFEKFCSGVHIPDADLPSLADYIKKSFVLSTAPSTELLRKTNSYIEESGKNFWSFMEFTEFLDKHQTIKTGNIFGVSDTLNAASKRRVAEKMEAIRKARRLQ